MLNDTITKFVKPPICRRILKYYLQVNLKFLLQTCNNFINIYVIPGLIITPHKKFVKIEKENSTKESFLHNQLHKEFRDDNIFTDKKNIVLCKYETEK